MLKPSVRLHKLSSPGWEKDFLTPAEARDELISHICETCRFGDAGLFEGQANGSTNLYDLLATCCGAEYWLEELDG